MSKGVRDIADGPHVSHRRVYSVAGHAFLFATSLLLAFGLRYDFRGGFTEPDPWFTTQFLPYLPLCLAVKLAVFGLFGIYRDSWRYVGLRDLFSIVRASHASIFICVVLYSLYAWVVYTLLQDQDLLKEKFYFQVPWLVFLQDWVLTIGLVAGARIGFRFYNEELRPLEGGVQARLLIVGAGDAGDSVLREIIRASEDRYQVVGFVDDDPGKVGARIRGVDVLGKTTDVRKVCESYRIDEVLIAMPSAPQRRIRELIEMCKGTNLRFRTVPALSDLIEGRVQVSQIRPVSIEDLLGRDPVTLDTQAIGEYIRGKVVMVTGAGGSIGSEMCRQIARFQPKMLLLVERMENALFEIDRDLQRQYPELCRMPCVADIADASRIRQLLRQYRPTAVFHAAAHKHVPMMEWNPGEAIKNNVIGTRSLADCVSEAGVEKFVMISTDKAVNPTSVMGCTKRVAEMYVQQLGSHTATKTEFVTVRFGNVLGSSGSVVPIFKEQIARGGPVTVTHPEMTRYFMTIPEAAQLVLQAGAMGKGGEIFLLDMGEPVKIVDLAIDLITLSGLRPHEDVELHFTGMRPGEKLFEELSIAGEDVSPTKHPKIGIMLKRPEDFGRVCERLAYLASIADTASADDLRAELARTVPEYTPYVPPPPQGVEAAARAAVPGSGSVSSVVRPSPNPA
jgi:FlaA1/EpsC-like NDP-sugar epimerase